MRLLLAEDEKELSNALVVILKHSNYSVDAVYNGQDALDYITNGDYDGVVLDIMMPKMDGLAVMEKFANDKSLKKIPSFIVVSAVGQERITENAFNLGAATIILPSRLPQKNFLRESEQ